MLAITVTGNVAADPRVNTVGANEVCNLTILSNSKKGGEDITTAVEAAIWGKRSEVASKYIKKGSLVTVTGTGYVETYEHKGEHRAKISMNASDFTLPPKPKALDEDAF